MLRFPEFIDYEKPNLAAFKSHQPTSSRQSQRLINTSQHLIRDGCERISTMRAVSTEVTAQHA